HGAVRGARPRRHRPAPPAGPAAAGRTAGIDEAVRRAGTTGRLRRDLPGASAFPPLTPESAPPPRAGGTRSEQPGRTTARPQAAQHAVAMPPGLAEEELVEHGALEVKVEIVFPGVADPAVEL